MPPRVLTVARWYPSHDSPGRGSFVADLVAATRDVGVEHVVISFDPIRATRHLADPVAERARAVAAWAANADPRVLLARPRTWAVPGVPVTRLPVVPMPGDATPGKEIAAHREALEPFADRLVATWQPDVIHAHTGIPDGVVAATVGARHGIPVVVSEHASTIEETLQDGDARRRYLELLETADVVAVSPPLRARLATALEVPEARIGILPNPVAIEGFRPGDAPRVTDELLWVGSRGPHKGIEVLLRAVAIVREARPGVRLRMIGRPRLPADDDRWRAMAAELGIGEAVSLESWAPREAVAGAMQRAAVFVHPSPSETFGVVAAEAIAAGLPVAARPSGGVPWIIETAGGFGAVAGDGTPEAFASAILGLLERPPPVNPGEARGRLESAFGAAAVARAAVERYPDGSGGTGVVPAPSNNPLPSVLVGIERAPTLRAFDALPATVRTGLSIVTAAGEGMPETVPARLIEPDLDAGHRRALADFDAASAGVGRRLVARLGGRSPAAERTRLVAGRPAARQRALAEALREVIGRDGPVAVMATDLGGTAAILDNAGVATLAPGGVRWLADRADEDPRAP
ncbi:MAG TPA: glycosyltransferase [Candidatus Limnocylindrales bacterium]|nr:glycosyltransferase [Candidatus Limnocylindrales bacterium]